ncbi:MAG: hypothetical protein K1060chlam1_01062 [Candidatus Anoxychlamydiales bacterium]|nr:hypothetical protein [Candidatus Anoxychlamydiales bacterium]
MAAAASVREGRVEIDPAMVEEAKKEEEQSRREKMKAAVEKAVPSVQEGARASTDGAISVGGLAARAATRAYAPGAEPFVDSSVEVVKEEAESIHRRTDASVRKTADVANRSIDNWC